MAQDWASFLNQTAQELIGNQAANLQRTTSAPVAVSPTGVTYTEGKPANTVAGLPPTILGIKPLYLGIGIAAAVGLYLVMRK